MAFCSRKATRLRNYDYSKDNYYFITICTHDKQCIFGTTEELSLLGKIASRDMEKISKHYEGVYVDNYVIMPNHIHAIIVLQNSEGTQKRHTLGEIIGQYKSGVSRQIRKMKPDAIVWQRSFHDHIIRNRKAYEQIWSYVEHNALKWETDCFYPGVKEF